MARLTVRLPETLHNQLVLLAEHEGVSLNQYITYTLARHVARAYTVVPVSQEAILKQRGDYAALLKNLGQTSYQELDKALSERHKIERETGLTQEVVEQLRERISKYRPGD